MRGFHESQSSLAKCKLMCQSKMCFSCVCVCVCMRACVRARARACVCARTWNTKLVSFTNWFSKYSKCHKFVFFLFQEDFYAPPQWVSYLFLSFIPSASLKLCKILIGFVNIYLWQKIDQLTIIGAAADTVLQNWKLAFFLL